MDGGWQGQTAWSARGSLLRARAGIPVARGLLVLRVRDSVCPARRETAALWLIKQGFPTKPGVPRCVLGGADNPRVMGISAQAPRLIDPEGYTDIVGWIEKGQRRIHQPTGTDRKRNAPTRRKPETSALCGTPRNLP